MISLILIAILIIVSLIIIAFYIQNNKMKKTKKQESIKGKKVIISIGIAILFVMFVAYAIESFYPSPEYNNFCPEINKQILTKEECQANNGTWQQYPKPTEFEEGYCDLYSNCYEKYRNASEPYNRNVFFIAITLGIIVLVISFIPKLETVSLGFMSGSILLIIYGTIRYWGSLSNIWKTIMIGFALGVLVWISYKKLR